MQSLLMLTLSQHSCWWNSHRLQGHYVIVVIDSGLGICSLVFHFALGKDWIALFYKKRWERIAHGRSFLKSDGAKSDGSDSSLRHDSLLGIKRGKSSEKLSKTWWKLRIFSCESLVFFRAKEQNMIKSLKSLLFIEWQEWFAYNTLL